MSIKLLSNKELITVDTITKFGEEFHQLNKHYIDGNVVINKDNLQEMKKKRAEYNNQFKEIEEMRKFTLKELDKERNELTKVYKPNVTDHFNKIDVNFKKSIDEIENEEKQEKENRVKLYFDELKQLNNIDFINFNDIGLNITLTVSENKLKEQTLDFVKRVVSDLELIGTQIHAERIKVRYMAIINVSQAIKEVNAEISTEEQLKTDKVIEKPIEVVEEPKALSKPKVKEKDLIVLFKVTATRTQILELKSYMEKEGIKYE